MATKDDFLTRFGDLEKKVDSMHTDVTETKTKMNEWDGIFKGLFDEKGKKKDGGKGILDGIFGE